MQVALYGHGEALRAGTPLMWLDKAPTWRLAEELGGEACRGDRRDSATCYLGERGTRHDWGYGCGDCPACRLRAEGFDKWKTSGM